jgi:hypothetical protein
VVSFTFQPITHGNEIRYPLNRKLRGAQNGLVVVGKRKIQPFVGSFTLAAYLLASHFAELPWPIPRVGLEVNSEKTKYMFMSRHQTAGQSNYIRVANKSFEKVAKFKYLGATLTDQNCIHEEIRSRQNSGNACYHAVQNLLSSHLLSRNVKIKIYKTNFTCGFVWV